MGSIICSLLRSKMKEQQSNYRVLADPKHILQILFCSEQWESVGTKGKQALAQAVFHAGMARDFLEAPDYLTVDTNVAKTVA